MTPHVPADRAESKARGAFYTPRAIADYLAKWAIATSSKARVIDPTCGDGVFLEAAARRLTELGTPRSSLGSQVYGMDLDEEAVAAAGSRLQSQRLSANLIAGDFFKQAPPGTLMPSMPEFDAVLGNPPFIRYHRHAGDVRRTALEAALRQGVRLSGLASSWAAILIHASAFLKTDGRLAMVMPAELLTVGYAEPVRTWLQRRFGSVKLVMFERLQFESALEDVVLLVAEGSGGCDAFSLFYVTSADDLPNLQPMDSRAVALADDGKWTNLLLPLSVRGLFDRTVARSFVPMSMFGSVSLGTVTGANHYFALSESTRREYELEPTVHVLPIFPPSSRHHRGVNFTRKIWEGLRDKGERVWLFCPQSGASGVGFSRYVERGIGLGVPETYKSRARRDWTKPPLAASPDLFFTYMSHRYPRLIANRARVFFLNSMHGLRLNRESADIVDALPIVALNSVTMLGAELHGRSYGGGILKMEPREAAKLPLPSPEVTRVAWKTLRPERDRLERQLMNGLWTNVVARVDEVVLRDTIGLSRGDAESIVLAGRLLRSRRLDRNGARNVELS